MNFEDKVKQVQEKLNVNIPEDYLEYLKKHYNPSKREVVRNCYSAKYAEEPVLLNLHELKTGEDVLKRFNLTKNGNVSIFNPQEYKSFLVISYSESHCIFIDTRKVSDNVYMAIATPHTEMRAVIVPNEHGENEISIAVFSGDLKRCFKNFEDYYDYYVCC